MTSKANLQSSGVITATDLNQEMFRANTATVSLNNVDFRALANLNAYAANTIIKMSDFYSKCSVGFKADQLTQQTVGELQLFTNEFNVPASITLNTNGTVTLISPTVAPLPLGFWGVASGLGSGHEVMFDQVSGGVTVPSAGSWIALTATRTASWSYAGFPDPDSGFCRIRIRRPTAANIVLATLNVTFSSSSF